MYRRRLSLEAQWEGSSKGERAGAERGNTLLLRGRSALAALRLVEARCGGGADYLAECRGASGGKALESFLLPGGVRALETDALRQWSNSHTLFPSGSSRQFGGWVGLRAGASYWLGLRCLIYMRRDLWVLLLHD